MENLRDRTNQKVWTPTVDLIPQDHFLSRALSRYVNIFFIFHILIKECFIVSQLESSSSSGNKSHRFFWIKISLFEKKLHRIISFLVVNAERYQTLKLYKWDLFFSDSLNLNTLLLVILSLVPSCLLWWLAPVLLSLQDSTVTPFGQFLAKYLFFSKSDNFCFRSDPSAGELVQRHRLSIERENNLLA